MNAKDVIRQDMQLSEFVFDSFLGDLSDADLLVRPTPAANHIAWQLGHLISSENSMIEAVSPGLSPALPAGFAESHKKEQSSSNDAARFLKKQQYIDLFKKQRQATRKALDTIPEADLSKPAPESYRQFFPTVAAVFSLQAGHIMMHSGQWTVVRRHLGKPVLF